MVIILHVYFVLFSWCEEIVTDHGEKAYLQQRWSDWSKWRYFAVVRLAVAELNILVLVGRNCQKSRVCMKLDDFLLLVRAQFVS